MKPWEDEGTVRQFRQMSGEATLKMGMDLTRAALRLLIDGIRHDNPRISRERLEKEIERCTWGNG